MYRQLPNVLLIAALTYIPITTYANTYLYDNEETLTQHDSLSEAIQNGKTGLQFRARHENAKEGNGLKTGKASTLRSKISYSTGSYSHLSGAVSLTDVTAFFGQPYNPDVNDLRKPDYSKIEDPKGTGLTQAEIRFSGFDKTNIRFGRQAIKLDNERYISDVDFRQFPQSFDAISVHNKMIPDLSLFYAYITHVNTSSANGRNSEGRRKMSTHLLNIGWDAFLYGKLIGYVYFLKDKDITTNSNTSLGIRLEATEDLKESLELDYQLEFAQQKGKFNNPNKYTAYYALAEVGKRFYALDLYLGLEHLGGHSDINDRKFQTPLGDYHKFNGLVDAFKTTPQQGLDDIYLKATAKAGEIMFMGAYHYFRFTKGDTKRAGHEFDLGAEVTLSEHVRLDAAYAKFNARNNSGTNTRRLWVSLNAIF